MAVTFKTYLEKYFYLTMSLLVCAIVVTGFSRTIGNNLIHPLKPPQDIVYVHALVFSLWVVLFIVQSILVRASNVSLHRRLGMAGAMMGCLMPILGASAAIINHRGELDDSFLSVSLNDMVTFAIAFGLAIYWRRKPEFHKRLMIIATCALTAAAFARIPLVPDLWWYPCVDGLIMLGILRDLIVMKRPHPVYLIGLPAVMTGQAISMYLFIAAPPAWMSVVGLILG